jgi:hypothetical protein
MDLRSGDGPFSESMPFCRTYRFVAIDEHRTRNKKGRGETAPTFLIIA